MYVKGTNVPILHETNSKVFILFPDVSTLSQHFICRLAMNNEEEMVALFPFLPCYHCLYKYGTSTRKDIASLVVSMSSDAIVFFIH